MTDQTQSRLCGIDMSRCIPNMTSDAAAMLEADAAEIAALKAENERIRQNSVSQEAYQMMCEERDAAVKDLKNRILGNGSACIYCKYCKSSPNDIPCCECGDIPNTRAPTKWQWRGPQKGKE